MIDRDSITALVTASIRGNAGGRVSPDVMQACIDKALRQYSVDHKREEHETIELLAGVAEYSVMHPVLSLNWHDWTLPDSLITETYPKIYASIGQASIRMSYPPTERNITDLGSSVRVMYSTHGHATEADIPEWHADRIEMLSTAYVMLALASMDIIEPVQLHKGMGDMSPPRTPVDQYRALMRQYGEMLESSP